MSFFYDLNKKLDSIRATPEVTHKQLNERANSTAKDVEESAFQAAIGKKKYGEEGMKALQKAGRDNASAKTMSTIRNKYDKYDESAGPATVKSTKPAPAKPSKPAPKGEFMGTIKGGVWTADPPKPGEKGVPAPSGDPEGVKEAGMTPKQKSFAKLAPPANKITFADKIAGAKKEVDEMLGDVAAEAMRNALSPKQKKIDMNKNGKLDANDFAMLRKGGKPEMDEEKSKGTAFDMSTPRASTPKVGSIERGHKHDIKHTATGRVVTRRTDDQGNSVGADDESDADTAPRGRGRPKGTKNVSSRAKVFQRKSKLMTKEGEDDPAEKGEYDREGDMALDDIDTIESAANELQSIIDAEDNLPEWVQSKINKAMDYLDTARDYMAAQGNDQEPIAEKAVSKQQQKFMGMAHAMQKGEKIKGASKELKKVARTMKPKDAEDFAATKHKGLPEKKKPEAKKKEKEVDESSTTAGSVASAATGSKGGMSFGKGIYDSMNRELENMIAESMSINMSMNNDEHGGPSKSLTVTATDDDAMKLSQLLRSAGLGGGSDQGYGGTGYQSACGCSEPGCGCDQQAMDEAYGDTAPTENAPDYPTNTETAQDNFEYSGGLNGPKSTGQSTVPVLASQDQRQHSYAAEKEDAIRRMMEMAGVKKKEVDEEKTEEGNLFTGNLAKARADGKKEADLDGDGNMEKVRESVAGLWKEYKGKYGV